MSTSVHSRENKFVPGTVGTQLPGPDMDVRPRIRRRVPNTQKGTQGSSGILPSHPPKPSSTRHPVITQQPHSIRRDSEHRTIQHGASSTRPRNCSAGSARSHNDSARHRDSSAGRTSQRDDSARQRDGSARRRDSSAGRVKQIEPEQSGEQDIKFTDIPSVRSSTKFSRLQEKDIQKISAREILESSQESRYESVYQVDLHASQLAHIDNLERFTKLRVLDLSCNYIQRIDNLNHNLDLRELKLYDNDLETIENLEKLRDLLHLQLQHNRIKVIGKGIQGQRKVKILRLDSNCLCKLEVRELASCGALTSLDLSNNKLDSIAALSCLTNLEEVFLVNNRLRTISDLSRCKKLQEVDVSYNKLSDVAGLKGLSQLSCLHASNNQLNSLKSIGKLKALQELNIAANRVTDLKHLVDYYPGLQILDVSDNYVETWQNVEKLCVLRELVELYISGNPFSSETGPKPLYHTELRTLLDNLDILDGAHLKKLSSRPGTPLMRPMSASCVITSRQVQTQMKSIDDEMSAFEETLASRFESLRTTMEYLPKECASRPVSAASSTTRPPSRGGRRSRIQIAQEFAAQSYMAEGDG